MQSTCSGGGGGGEERGGGSERQSGRSVNISMIHRDREGEEEECWQPGVKVTNRITEEEARRLGRNDFSFRKIESTLRRLSPHRRKRMLMLTPERVLA